MPVPIQFGLRISFTHQHSAKRSFESAKGAKYNSLGQRRRNSILLILEALRARNEVVAAGSRKTNPLVSFRAFSA